MYRRAVPALVAIPCMAMLMSLAAGVPFAALGGIITGGAVKLAPFYVAVIFGALLGRVTIETGIARTIVNLAAEFGGERPFVLSLVFCAIVAVLFASLQGLGGIIMVGSIVLPIMMTAGVPRTIAATLFLMSFALGYIFNIANWTFYNTFFGVPREQLVPYAILLALVDAAVLLAYAAVSFRRARRYATWAVGAPDDSNFQRVPAVALVTPLIPLLLFYSFHTDAAVAFLIAALFGVLLTRPALAVQRLVAAAIRGVEDVAPAVLLFMGIGMLLVATMQPQFAAALRPLVAGDWLRTPLGYVMLFGVASPLVLYRGPLNPFGVGVAIFTVLLTAHVLPPVVIVAAVMAVVQVQNVCDPTNTANVWVANFTGVPIQTITRRTLPYQTAVAIVATLAVDDDGTPFGRVGADVVASGLSGEAWTATRIHDDPNASDCSGKRYAAYLRVGSSVFALASGDDLDIGLRLEDCGGWIVNEWHEHAVIAPHAGGDAARALANAGLARLRAWALADPVRSGNLFALGAAVRPGDRPAYFYALFRTSDGNLRIYVRGGGPAYVAGLRSGEVVENIDGKAWWLYGTYPAQELAYDGKPHTFEVLQGGRAVEIALGAPFTAMAGDGE
jgi:hypothetical protein